jgi:photosystem II stability/assembly factor-like uncharacterized protein
VAIGLACSTPAQTPTWHFEFTNGQPDKLVWTTEAGRSYNLRESDSLQSWVQVPDFPKIASGSIMDYPFTSAHRGFFDLTESSPTGGGWQTTPAPPLPSGSRFVFHAVSTLDTTRIWASGTIEPGGEACVVRSEDGGLTWTLIYRAGSVGAFWELQMVTAEKGYAAGTGVRRTFDGGTTWTLEQGNQPNPPGTLHTVGPEGYVYGMAAVDADHVWTAGYDGSSAGVIFHRVPERPQPDPANPNYYTPWWMEWAMTNRGMYGLSAVNTTTAWATGFAGFIWKTTDGQNWTQQPSQTSSSLHDVKAVNESIAWAVGDGGTILKTTNGGTTWTQQNSGTTENLRRIAAVNETDAWTVGTGGTILHTTNGGTTWTRQQSGTTATLHGLAAIDTSHAWIAGDEGTLLHTTDGGQGIWAAPSIRSVTPSLTGINSSPPMVVTITGSGFRGGQPAVSFGDIPSEYVTFINASTLLATTPYHQAGTFDLTISNEDGQRATLPRAVTFLPSPVLTRFSPLHAPALESTRITLEGFNLGTVDRATLYMMGEAEPLAVEVTGSTAVILTVPASATRQPGAAALVLETAQNQSTYAEYFQFTPAEGPAFAVTAISPSSGPQLTAVTVTGLGFSESTTLELCEAAIAISRRSATELTGPVSGVPGPGRLLITHPGIETLSLFPAFVLTSGTPPTLSQLFPAVGPASGGTSVNITGTHFEKTDTITFDGFPGDITSLTPTTIVVTTPPHAPGPVNVIIMTENLERSAFTLTHGFTYK